jgi:hypothetical protein
MRISNHKPALDRRTPGPIRASLWFFLSLTILALAGCYAVPQRTILRDPPGAPPLYRRRRWPRSIFTRKRVKRPSSSHGTTTNAIIGR